MTLHHRMDTTWACFGASMGLIGNAQHSIVELTILFTTHTMGFTPCSYYTSLARLNHPWLVHGTTCTVDRTYVKAALRF